MNPGIDPQQFRTHVVRPAIEALGLWSESAEALLMGTAAQESHLGRYLHQVGGGPALGPFQMEPATYRDIWANYLAYRRPLANAVHDLAGVTVPNSEVMAYHLRYAAAMARIHYLRVPQRLPAADDIVGLAQYWKQHYNTPAGRGTVDEFVANYRRFLT